MNVNEVKRQAVAELQKAVSAAEIKASELVAAERAKMERIVGEARRQAAEDALTVINHQEDNTEVVEHEQLHVYSQLHSLNTLILAIVLQVGRYLISCCCLF